MGHILSRNRPSDNPGTLLTAFCISWISTFPSLDGEGNVSQTSGIDVAPGDEYETVSSAGDGSLAAAADVRCQTCLRLPSIGPPTAYIKCIGS
jgi:hypothetical protein